MLDPLALGETDIFAPGPLIRAMRNPMKPRSRRPTILDEFLVSSVLLLEGKSLLSAYPPFSTEISGVSSSIQARIASMFSSAGVKPPPTLARDGARVCRLRTPELLETDKASKDARIQREIEALRGLQRVGCGSKIIAKTRAFGGDGPANAPLSGGVALSLQAIEILERVKKEQAKS